MTYYLLVKSTRNSGVATTIPVYCCACGNKIEGRGGPKQAICVKCVEAAKTVARLGW